jgi:hypothetical protein
VEAYLLLLFSTYQMFVVFNTVWCVLWFVHSCSFNGERWLRLGRIDRVEDRWRRLIPLLARAAASFGSKRFNSAYLGIIDLFLLGVVLIRVAKIAYW